ncbi:MAG: hypothetical protein ACP5LI_05905 [Hydrogenobaculum sp.]
MASIDKNSVKNELKKNITKKIETIQELTEHLEIADLLNLDDKLHDILMHLTMR